MQQPPVASDRMQPVWKIRLFGSLEIEHPDAHVFAPGGKKVGELLAWLALQKGARIRREDLAERC